MQQEHFVEEYKCLSKEKEIQSNCKINAFFQMTSSRGLPQVVVSDNGTNFVEASSTSRELINQLDEKKIKISTANRIIKSRFNPCYSPHFGEMHETMSKSTKKAIYGTLGLVVITDDDDDDDELFLWYGWPTRSG